MRLPRLTIKYLMALVVVSALVILAERWRRIAAEYSAAASRFAAAEASESHNIDSLGSVLESTRTDLDRTRASFDQTDPVVDAVIRYYKRREKDVMSELAKSVALRSRYIEMRRRYERAAHRPWEPLPADTERPYPTR